MKRSSWWVLVMLLSFISCTETKEEERILPIWGERDVVYKVVDGEEVADTIFHTVPAFEYLNHDSTLITSDQLKNKVWIADFFFSHCPTICPPMTSEMKRLCDETMDVKDHIQFLSFSIDPDRDTPERLREYRDIYKITADHWQFFTGGEEETHLLAKEFFSGAQRDEEAEGGFGHTSYFALVDHSGYVRGVYDGTSPVQVDSLQSDLRKLLKHEYGVEGSSKP